jgi:hypothetical protein
MLSGESWVVFGDADWSFGKLKKAVCKESGIPQHELRLLKDGQIVDDEVFLGNSSEGRMEFDLIRRDPKQALLLMQMVKNPWNLPEGPGFWPRMALSFASDESKADEEIVLAAIRHDVHALRWASPILKSDEKFMRKAVRLNCLALQYADSEIWSDRELVYAAVTQPEGCALVEEHAKFLSGFFKELEVLNDREIVLAAVTQRGTLLKYVSRMLQGDRGVVLAAVRANGLALYFASKKLKDDREVVLAAVQQNSKALEFASAELRDDQDLMLAASFQGSK